jgi:C_GCAxxG_C_C family probable redox protein
MSQSQAVVDQAIAHNKNGYNCAQSVLLALHLHMDINGENSLIPKIAAGFGGGIGRCGSVCGALTGSIMAVGIKMRQTSLASKSELKPTPMQKHFTNSLKQSTEPCFVET